MNKQKRMAMSIWYRFLGILNLVSAIRIAVSMPVEIQLEFTGVNAIKIALVCVECLAAALVFTLASHNEADPDDKQHG